MAQIQLNQIRQKLEEQIVPAIDVSDLKKHADNTKQTLSRSVAAVALRILANIDPVAASKAITDGSQDNGIDAIFYDPVSYTLYLVQSKWSDAHASSIELGDILKFIQGVKDLTSQKKNKFNARIKSRWIEIDDALRRLSTIQLVIAFSGSGNLSVEVDAAISEFIETQNDTSDLFFKAVISQRELFQYFVHEAAPPQIDLTISLSHYGLIEAPHKAVYGQLSVIEVANWYKAFGNNIFSKNIRNFLGMRSEVNSLISKTVRDQPQNFWYFNNGITIICESMKRKAIGSNDRSIGVFDCKGVTIINGAQTAGAIGKANLKQDSSASLQARIIEIAGEENEIVRQITRASNTQNRIDARNFVALDPEQERIRIELLVDGINYEYREGEPLDDLSKSFDFVEAIIALACAGDDVSYVATAKRYVGGLYADIESAPYKVLFNTGTNSKRLWNIVQASRRIDVALQAYLESDERPIAVHGNRFLQHCILKRLSADKASFHADTLTQTATKKATSQVMAAVGKSLASRYPDSYLAPLFKNVTKCSAIRKDVLGI